MVYEFHPQNVKLPFIYHHNITKSEYYDSNWHENIEILYVTEGSGYIQEGNEIHSANVNDIFIINSYVPHRGISKTGLRYFCFIIDSEFCVYNGFNTNELLYKTKINDPKASQLIETIMEELSENKPYGEGAVKTYALNLLLYLTRNYCIGETNPLNHSKNSDNIKNVIGYIRSHFEENLTIDALSDQAGLSKYYFSREFKRLTGMTVVTYVNLVRCENAKKLFKSDKYSVNEVCEMCGFDNLSYFSKTFKKFTNLTPSEYKKSVEVQHKSGKSVKN